MPDPVGGLGLGRRARRGRQRVRPGLHEPRGRHRRRRHRRPEPRHLLALGIARAAPRRARRARPPQRASSACGGEPGDLVRRRRRRSRRGRRSPRSTIASHASLSVAAATAASSVQSRWAIWVATVQPAAGVGVAQPSSSRPATTAHELVALGRRGRRAGRRAGRSSWRLSARRRGCAAHWSRIRPRRRASSVMVLARPRPRTRSRVACTSSRTPGRDSSAPSSSTVSRWASRPTRCSSGATAASSCGVGAGGHPQLERGGEDRRGEVVGEHLRAPRGCGARPRGSRSAAAAAAPRRGPR